MTPPCQAPALFCKTSQVVAIAREIIDRDPPRLRLMHVAATRAQHMKHLRSASHGCIVEQGGLFARQLAIHPLACLIARRVERGGGQR